MDYSNLYEICNIDDSMYDPNFNIEDNIILSGPIVNIYDAGYAIHIFPYSKHAVIVSNLLNATREELWNDFLKDEERELLSHGIFISEAIEKMIAAIMQVEKINTIEEIEKLGAWNNCLEYINDNSRAILDFEPFEVIELYHILKDIYIISISYERK